MSEVINKSILDDLIEKNIVFKVGSKYYSYTKVGKVSLGKNAIETETFLKSQKIEKFITPEEFQSRQLAKKQVKSSDPENASFPPPSDSATNIQKNTADVNAFGELTAKLEESRPNDINGELLDIFVYDSARNRWVCTKYENDPFIKTLSVRFVYKSKHKMVQNGPNWTTGKGYHVVSKKMVKIIIDGNETTSVRPTQDDTPNEDFFSVGDQVMCVILKKSFIERQQAKLLKANMQLPKVHATRQHEVHDAKKRLASGQNIEDAFRGIENSVKADLSQVTQELKHSTSYSTEDTIEKLRQVERLSESDPEKASELLRDINNQANTDLSGF